MSSSVRTTAMVLDTLVALDPKNEAIKPLVAVIMKERRKINVYWDTQENIYSLLALTNYAKTVAGTPPSVTVELGGKQILKGALAGKSKIKIAKLPLTPGELKITPQGEVQYNVSVLYRKDPKAITAASNGIALTREYLDEDGKPKTSFQVGDVVLVRVTANMNNDFEHIMVSEPLPAGFEALNTKFKTVGTAGIKQSDDWGTFREMYDDRVDFASEWTWKGGYTYEFMIRAIATGKFTRPPTTAERMYEPETNARTALDVIEVKPK
jgi:uncharacterized protein YfaS (alpha-2-macroglobulin family)